MKLDFEIAVDQQTKAHNRTFEVVPDLGCPRDSHALIWSIFDSILPNHLNMLKTMLWGALLVSTSLLNTKFLSKSDKNWTSYKQNTICQYF